MVASRNYRRRFVPDPIANPTDPLRRRKRRMLASLPLGAVAWVGLAGLPTAPAAPSPGTMHTEIITLSGPEADPVPGADASALRAAATTAGPGWETAVDVDDGTQSVATSWVGAPDGIVSVRGNGADGWTEWVELASESEDAPDDSTRTSGGMAWFGSEGVDEIEVKVVAGDLADLEVQPMRYDAPSGGAAFATASAGAATAQPEILPRSSYTSKGWATGNSGCSGGPTSASGGVKYAVVHHTTNSNTYAASDVPAMLASIYTYHTGTNGWCDTGYNFIIDRFGRTWEGRSGGVAKAIVGGHAQGFNTGSVGVSFLGQYEPSASPTSAQPTDAALAAAARLIGWKLSLNGLDPTGTTSVTSGGSNKWPKGTVLTLPRIIGHRDVGQTACPGANVYSKLGAMRTAAKASQGGATTTTPTTTTTTLPPAAYAPFSSAQELVKQQYRDVMRREATANDLSYWSSRVGNSWSPGQFIAYMETSTEADNRVHAVTRLYKAYFLRNPDHSGLTYWLNRRGEGRTLVSISQSFATSSEFRNRYGSLSNSQFVDRVYRNVLGRAADASGTTYWKSRLDAGMPRGQVMANFSQSSEYVRSTNNGVYVVGIHAALLQRAPASDVYTLYEAALTNGSTTLTNLSNTLFDSAEYAARFD
jgi:hypothetical protein